MEITIYTDGSCIGNPGPGGWAALVMMPGKKVTLKGKDPETTNNRMEMSAILAALTYLHKKSDIEPEELAKIKINLHSDSNLLIQTLNLGWKRKKNLDLWEKLDKLRAGLNVSWQWVKAHHTNEHNNYVDKIAQEQARKIA